MLKNKICLIKANDYETGMEVEGYLIFDIDGEPYIAKPLPNLDEDLDLAMVQPPRFDIVKIKKNSIVYIKDKK